MCLLFGEAVHAFLLLMSAQPPDLLYHGRRTILMSTCQALSIVLMHVQNACSSAGGFDISFLTVCCLIKKRNSVADATAHSHNNAEFSDFSCRCHCVIGKPVLHLAQGHVSPPLSRGTCFLPSLQDARRERLKKEAASEAKKAAATQKGNKTEANRRARHRRQKKKQALKAQMQIAGQPQEAPIERVVSTQM